MRDPYETLGVGRDASHDDVKRAYVKLSLRYHPDRNGSNGSTADGDGNGAEKGSEEMYAEVREAYELLRDGMQVREPNDRGRSAAKLLLGEGRWVLPELNKDVSSPGLPFAFRGHTHHT